MDLAAIANTSEQLLQYPPGLVSTRVGANKQGLRCLRLALRFQNDFMRTDFTPFPIALSDNSHLLSSFLPRFDRAPLQSFWLCGIYQVHQIVIKRRNANLDNRDSFAIRRLFYILIPVKDVPFAVRRNH